MYTYAKSSCLYFRYFTSIKKQEREFMDTVKTVVIAGPGVEVEEGMGEQMVMEKYNEKVIIDKN